MKQFFTKESALKAGRNGVWILLFALATAEISAQVVFINQVRPVSCAGGADGALSAGGSGGTPPYSFLWSTGAQTFSISNLAAGPYTLTVTDSDGLQATAFYELADPVQLTVSLATTPTSNCVGVATGEITAVVTGGKTPYTYLWSTGATSAALSGLPEGTYMVEIMDANNCQTGSVGEIVVQDLTDPVIAAKNIDAYLDADGNVSVSAEAVDDGSTDNCGIVSMTLDQTSFNCADVGDVNATLTITDEAGNSSSETVTITIIDNIAPSVPTAGLTLSLDDTGFATLSQGMVMAGAVDNCGIVLAAISQTEFSCTNIGNPQMISVILSDASGNSTEVVRELMVADVTPPTVEFVPNAKLYLNDNGLAFPTMASMILENGDNCGVDQASFDVVSFSCADIGMKQVNFTTSDVYGNSITLPRQVQVADTTKPKFTLQSITIPMDANGNASLTPAMLMPYASDNCGIAEVAVQFQSYSCDNINNAQTEIIVFDLNGNFVQKTLQVNIEDNILPTVSVENITVELNLIGEYILTTDQLILEITDNCAIADVSLSQTIFTCADFPAVTTTLMVTDAGGNEVAQTFTVNVLDKINPTIQCIPSVNRCAGPFEAGNLVEAQDNCSFIVNQTSGPMEGQILAPGSYTLNYLIVDISGNDAACSVQVNVGETPVVDLGEDMEVTLGTIVTLTAGADNSLNYLWSTGETTSSIAVNVTEDVEISVIVTASNGCAVTDDIFIQTQIISGIADAENNNALQFYPNPTNGILHIAFDLSEVQMGAKLAVMDMNGRMVHQQVLNTVAKDQVVDLDLSGLTKGMYLITVTSDKSQYTGRIVKH